jgi:hypothetical protein
VVHFGLSRRRGTLWSPADPKLIDNAVKSRADCAYCRKQGFEQLHSFVVRTFRPKLEAEIVKVCGLTSAIPRFSSRPGGVEACIQLTRRGLCALLVVLIDSILSLFIVLKQLESWSARSAPHLNLTPIEVTSDRPGLEWNQFLGLGTTWTPFVGEFLCSNDIFGRIQLSIFFLSATLLQSLEVRTFLE